MATEQIQEQHERLIRVFAEIIQDDRKAIDKEELKDLEEEAETEIFDTNQIAVPSNKWRGIRLPTDGTVVTRNSDGSPLSYFGDSEWTFRIGHSVKTIKFGHVHDELGLDLSSDLCTPLVSFHKTICYFQLPGNNPSTIISSYASVWTANSCILHMCVNRR